MNCTPKGKEIMKMCVWGIHVCSHKIIAPRLHEGKDNLVKQGLEMYNYAALNGWDGFN